MMRTAAAVFLPFLLFRDPAISRGSALRRLRTRCARRGSTQPVDGRPAGWRTMRVGPRPAPLGAARRWSLPIALAVVAWSMSSAAADAAQPEGRVAAILPQGVCQPVRDRAARLQAGGPVVRRSLGGGPAAARSGARAGAVERLRRPDGRPKPSRRHLDGGAAAATVQAARFAEITGYWAAVPPGSDAPQDFMRKVEELWASRPLEAVRQHWSAAFTSWVMCEAGFSSGEFRRSYRHRKCLRIA